MQPGVLIVFTAKTVEEILERGGTQSWVLNPSSMRDVRYVICTRNADRQYDEECGVRPEPHGSAFMVGKVSGMKKVGVRNGRDRYLVQFSEYALVAVPNFRGHARNPVTYSDIDAVKHMRLDIEKLEFQLMPPASAPAQETDGAVSPVKGLSIPEAKEGLSAFFGVPVESIQITISG